MSTKTIFTTAAILGILAIAAVAMARNGYGHGFGRGHMGQGYMAQGYHHGFQGWADSLTAEQRAELNTLTQAHFKQVQPLRADLFAKQAKLDALLVEPSANAGAIDALVDEVAELEAQLTKADIAFHAEITRKFGDDVAAGRGWGMHHGRGQAMGPGMGQGMNRGMGYGQGLCAGYGNW